jgi:DNA-binding beta-propeller fold protein YncE
MSRAIRISLYFLALPICLLCSAQTGPGYTHFEARHTHPIGLTPDGSRLLALNSAEARLSVFDVSHPEHPAPVLIAEIPVGLEPVSLRARTNDEVWVVNEVSDSVSVVSLSLGVTVATLPAPDEPADVVFAGDQAFVSCARNSALRVFDVATHREIAVIPLHGDSPRALAVDAAGTRVFAAFQLSGNRTTTLPRTLAPPPPAPTNPALPPAPRTGLIVDAGDPRITYTVLDHDVAEISVTELRVLRYHSDLGTNHFDLIVAPRGGDVWVASTEALNRTRFEPALRGRFVENRLAVLSPADGSHRHHDLNPGIDYGSLPNPLAQETALAQPTGLAFSADGRTLWVAAFGSDRVARISTSDGSVQARIDLRTRDGGSRAMRGPRGLALHPRRERLYVLNKLAHSISVIDTSAPESSALLAEVPIASHEPMPAIIKEGRGFLFDARLSGNGTASCATCHLDADRDGLAWDLGDPTGALVTVLGKNNSIHDPTPRPRVLHPMKGPMTTQTLRDLQGHRIFHWRGDRPTLQSFDVTYRDLLGGEVPAAADMDALAAYLLSLRHHPNPNRQLDRTLPASFAGADPIRGRDHFNDHAKSHCVTCHALPAGSDENIDLMAEIGSTQPIKTVPLRTVYQRAHFNGKPGATNITGFGLLHDGTGFDLPRGHFYVLDNLETLQELDDVTAFLLCFDTGTAPTVGFSRTLVQSTAGDTAVAMALDNLETQAAATACDAIARGRVAGQWRQWAYDPVTRRYRDGSTTPDGVTRAELLAGLGPDDALTIMGVPPSQGVRLGADRDLDTVADGIEPIPPLEIGRSASGLQLAWPESFRDWTVENAIPGELPWRGSHAPPVLHDGKWRLSVPGTDGTRWFRLKRTW